MNNTPIELGKVVGVWGVKGWIKIHSYTRNRTEIGDYSHWLLKTPRGEVTKKKVINCRAQGQGLVAQLEGVADRNEAQALQGQSIWVDQTQLPALPEGEFYWRELIGLTVLNTENTVLGRIDSIMETGANDVMIVELEQGDNKEALIPFNKEIITAIDISQGTITVDWDLAYLEE